MTVGTRESLRGMLEGLGLFDLGEIHHRTESAALVEQALRRGEGILAAEGPLVVSTGKHTGRAPEDKFVVRDGESEEKVWWDHVNRPLAPERFDALLRGIGAYLGGREVFVQDVDAGADREFGLPVRVITERAWHGLFARTMFWPAGKDRERWQPAFTILDAPGFHSTPERDGTRSSTAIAIDFARRLVLIGGTGYAGEIKKSVFTVLQYLLPPRGVLSMHAAASECPDGGVALFFGLSGTGKTTLSADPSRVLIGDDEHGWSDRGVFNFEHGCYAKVIRLSAEGEPEIHATTRRFGTVLENVACDPATRRLDLNSDAITENTRGAYPIEFIPRASKSGLGGHPRDIFFLTADAFGILPPLARLDADQAMYHFLSGYTAKLAGTEMGVKEPTAVFSACFGAPFLPLHPGVYSRLLGEKIARHRTRVWLLNTGWTGGPYGKGKRIPLASTRGMLDAALSGALETARWRPDPIFRFESPLECPGVPAGILQPRTTWADPKQYDRRASELADRFRRNFRQFEAAVSPRIRAAGPEA